MTHYKYSPKKNTRTQVSTARVYRQAGSRGFSKNKNAKSSANNFSFYNPFLVNMIFASTGILSIVSLALVFAPNLMTAKVAKADTTPKVQSVSIVTNYNSQESRPLVKPKSFLQPVSVELANEIIKK
jgi:hypothetical protein